VRSSHTSTAGLLAWPHPDGTGPLPARRPNQVTMTPVPLSVPRSPPAAPPLPISSISFLARSPCSRRRSSGRWCSGARAPRSPTASTRCEIPRPRLHWRRADSAPLPVFRIKPFDAAGALIRSPKMCLLTTDDGCCSDRDRRTGAAPKWKEMSGSSIFKAESAAAAAVPAASRDRQVRNFGSAFCE
jgi:hypothetical protein